MNTNLVFVKLGGSLITNKHQPETPRPPIIDQLAEELRQALEAQPDLRIVLGHGSGSFGHWVADHYQTQQGVHTPDEWSGFARVSAAASRLNRIVVDAFLEVGLPILSLQPSATATARGGRIRKYPLENVKRALSHGLIPLIFGDVAFDDRKGGTILSTEALFVYAAERLLPSRIILLGNAPGVLDAKGDVIPTITPSSYADVQAHLSGSACTDVTGGMMDKVKRMVALTAHHPGMVAHILAGQEVGSLRDALLHPRRAPGTRIHADVSQSPLTEMLSPSISNE